MLFTSEAAQRALWTLKDNFSLCQTYRLFTPFEMNLEMNFESGMNLCIKGYLTLSGHVHSGIIEIAWKPDRDKVTMKAMPNITSAHLKLNSFVKLK